LPADEFDRGSPEEETSNRLLAAVSVKLTAVQQGTRVALDLGRLEAVPGYVSPVDSRRPEKIVFSELALCADSPLRLCGGTVEINLIIKKIQTSFE
jgi:hypothetical protein